MVSLALKLFFYVILFVRIFVFIVEYYFFIAAIHFMGKDWNDFYQRRFTWFKEKYLLYKHQYWHICMGERIKPKINHKRKKYDY